MKKGKGIIVLIYIVLASSCVHTKNIIQQPSSDQLLPFGPAWAALWQQRSAEYKALCFQAYNLAKMRLDQELLKTENKPLAIVTDIDETILDNSPYFVRQAENGKTYTDSSWIKWTAEIRCDTIPGAASFFKYAASKGVTIFYITNRFQQEELPTLKNLQRWNFPNADTTHLFLLNSENSSKELRRLQVEKEYGDNLGDFSAFFDHLSPEERGKITEEKASLFGNKFIVLPNAMYGTWEDILYKEANANSLKDKNKILSGYLKR